jgi:anti-anti-sigma regulatory factor
LPVKMEKLENQSIIRLEGEMTVTSAAELKEILAKALSEGDLQLDLERAEEIDIAVMQLLWAAGREAERKGVDISVRALEAVTRAARDAGFEPWPK